MIAISKRLEKYCQTFNDWRSVEWLWQRHMEIITLKHNLASTDNGILRGAYGLLGYAQASLLAQKNTRQKGNTHHAIHKL